MTCSVQRAFYDSLPCGIFVHGLLRMGWDTCQKEVLLAFRCKRRGSGPSCAGRPRMAQRAAHRVACVMPWIPTRHWVVSGPRPGRDWRASAQDLTAKVHTISRPPSGQYDGHQAVKRGSTPQSATGAAGAKMPFDMPIRSYRKPT